MLSGPGHRTSGIRQRLLEDAGDEVGGGQEGGRGSAVPSVLEPDFPEGEENDVIIVSLVRSNPQRKLGFCAIENRIIVGLSRARPGMIIVGNSDMPGGPGKGPARGGLRG